MNKFWPNNAHDAQKRTVWTLSLDACMLYMSEHLSEAVQEKENGNKNQSHKMTHHQNRKRRP